MDVVVFFENEYADARGEELVRLAASRGWFLPCDLRGRGTTSAGAGVAAVAAPEGWAVSREGTAVRLYRERPSISEAAGPGSGGGWVRIRNGRYRAQVDERLLETVQDDAEADVVAVTVEPEMLAYREKIVANSSGRVMGFRRFYNDSMAPAAMGTGYPQLLVVRARRLGDFERGFRAGDRFADAVARWRAAGLMVSAVAVGGEVCDLSQDEGLRRCWAARARRRVAGGGVSGQARIEGEVVVEGGATIGDGAIVVGPSFVGAGARIGERCVVSGSMIGPGVEMRPGRIVRNRVLVSWDESDAEAGAAAGRTLESTVRTRVDAFREWPFFSYARSGKRIVDIVGSIVALAFLVTIFPTIAVAIKVNSRGPIFYAHRRQGLHGKEFLCLKFRTMRADGAITPEELRAISEVDGPQIKIEHDPRITLVGEFLRETNIDEVPQFLNVLAGHMSIVGPRPSPDEENQMCPSWREARLSVRPGITGAWQVYRSVGRRNDFEEWIHYDTEYVRRLSFRKDLVIMAKTAGVLVRGFGRLFVAKRSA